MDETDNGLFWNGSEEDGDVKSGCVEDEGTDCEVETVTLIGRGTQNLIRFVY